MKVLHNREEFKILAKGLSEAFHETKITISELLAEEDRVAVGFIFEGIHKGKLQDLPPTGKKIKVAAVAIVRFSDGQMVECWEEPDNLGMMQQLGLELVPKESVH
jgi:predicted ester cyclase